MITIFTLYLKYLRYQLLKVATRIIERPLYSEISSQPAPPLLLKLNAPMPLVQPFCGTWNCKKKFFVVKVFAASVDQIKPFQSCHDRYQWSDHISM